MTLFLPAFALLIYMCGLFVISLVRKDNGTADIGYGIGTVVAISAALASTSAALPVLILSALVLVWAIRLALRIYLKNLGKPEDFRYRTWRESWGTYFVVRSFFQIYLLQGVVIFAVASSVLLAIIFPQEPVFGIWIFGICVWCVGFFFESVADFQLDRFVANPENKGKILTTGLWAYSRHPNYFGESTMWWGIAIAASGLTSLWLFVFVSPLVITYLLLFVSGVPMLEKKWQGNPEWEAYKAKTSVFVPIPPLQ